MLIFADGTVTKRMTSPINPAMPGTSASVTNMHKQHTSTGSAIATSQKDLLMSLATSLQPPTTESSQSTPLTSTSMTLSTGYASTRPCRRTKKNWHDSQKEKAIQKREAKKKKKEQSENTLKSPESKGPDLRVAWALDEIFGMLLAETETNSKQKME